MRLKGHEDGHGLTELCIVETMDDPHPVNGAYHSYGLKRLLDDEEKQSGADLIYCGLVQFQRGPRAGMNSDPAILDGAVLSILIHRRECFQAGPYACPENAKALEHLLAVRQLDKDRANERAARGALGKNVK